MASRKKAEPKAKRPVRSSPASSVSSSPAPPRAAEDVDDRARRDVEEHGFHIIKVFSEREAPFAYTIGLKKSFDHPEVIVFGLNANLDFMAYVLSEVTARIRKGERFEHGAQKKGILPGYVCAFARFPRAAYDEHLGRAKVFYGGSGFECVQLIWPDPKKRLPWDPKVMPPVLARQPVFLRPDAGRKDPEWPFAEPHSHLVITSRQVVTGKEPVRYIGRFKDGDWQFVCNTTSEEADVVLTTLGWVVDHDPNVRVAAKLAPGQHIVRTSPREAWKRGRVEE